MASGCAAQAQTTEQLMAPTSEPVANLAGGWDVSSPDGSRKCRIQLNAREVADGRMVLGAPPACRRAIPALASVGQWALGRDGRIHLYAQDGAPLGSFRRQLDGQFRAEGWIELTLEAVGGKPGEATRAESVSQTLQAMTGEADARDGERARLAGRYVLARDRD
ncbi:MAG: AprI/Inh family metalloprotease inhibitor, partial [Beijerinckiaceae bacterium]